MESDERKPGAARWFLERLVKAPAAWIGAASAILVGNAMMTADVPIGGAIGFGVMVGAAIGTISFLAIMGVSSSHRKAIGGADGGVSDYEEALLEELRSAELIEDADLLGKILEERSAISRLAAREEGNPDLAHTFRLVKTIVEQSVGRADELQDLARRIKDPILEIPDGAEATVEQIRQQWVDAFRAIVDAKTRVRKGNALDEIDFLDDSVDSDSSRCLSDLTAQLREETQIAERVRDRIGKNAKTEFIPSRTGIVFDDKVADPNVKDEELE